jgi:deazaflavin-dependent oxidoreductase (nitroreductase family)
MTAPNVPELRAAEIRAMAADHVRRYVGTDGRDGLYIGRWRALILTTTGRRSGQPRSTPLIFGEDDGRHVIVASFAGLPQHPAWYLNLEADPDAWVQVEGERFQALARTVAGDERERLWPLMVDVYPLYADYAKKTDRVIPVVVLEPV